MDAQVAVLSGTTSLLSDYFPKGSNLTLHTPAYLEAVAAELNANPRQILNWYTPADRLAKLLTPAIKSSLG